MHTFFYSPPVCPPHALHSPQSPYYFIGSPPTTKAMQSYGVCNMVEESWCNYFFNSASGLSSTPLAISPVSEIVLTTCDQHGKPRVLSVLNTI